MAREIKFRIWDKEKLSYFQPVNEGYLGKIEQLYIGVGGSLFKRTMQEFTHESTFPDVYEVEQYTGLKDKNRVEIYEGDIVETEHQSLVWNDTKHHTGVVEYGEQGAFVVKALNKQTQNAKDPKKRYMYIAFKPDRTFEVLGNIHQNPDLLK